jgi:MoxR-like ATPase
VELESSSESAVEPGDGNPQPDRDPSVAGSRPGTITQERKGELIQAAFKVLRERGPDPVKASKVIKEVARNVVLTDHELSKNNSGTARWETSLRWYSADAVRAGWLVKGAKGTWALTEDGVAALALTPSEFITRAHRAYVEWQKGHKKAQPATALEQDDLDSLRTVLEGRTGPAWWVNQGGSYTSERDGGYLEAPTEGKAGRPLEHHVALKKLRPGDVVLHYANSALRAVSQVSEAAREDVGSSGQPSTLVVQVEYHEFETPIRLDFVPLRLRTPEYGPFTQLGGVQQVYLTQLSEAFVSGLLGKLGAVDERERPAKLAGVISPADFQVLDLDPSVVPGAIAALDAGNHLILTGPPGTGKTHLAQLIAESAARAGYTNGYVLATASSDWTTFDTLGGYMPNPADPGKLRFESGLILDAIASDKWLVLDEINRSDADKAFGALLTLLAGFETELAFRGPSGDRYKLQQSDDAASDFDQDTGVYHVGRNWRILATMNTRDKNSLYALSYAFMRRFSFVYVGPPSTESLAQILASRVSSVEGREVALKIAAASRVPLGPAILIDIAKLVAQHADVDLGIRNAVVAYYLPQLEGRNPKQVASDLRSIRQALGVDSATERVWSEVAGILVGSSDVEEPAEPNQDLDPDLNS